MGLEMMANGKEKKKVYRSVKEFEMEIFPKSYADRLATKKSEDPRAFGAWIGGRTPGRYQAAIGKVKRNERIQ